jgi:hypothetical protein
MSLARKPAKRSLGFTPKKKATFVALLAAKAEAKTDAAAAWAGAMTRATSWKGRHPMDEC